jgi:hypothetical protein
VSALARGYGYGYGSGYGSGYPEQEMGGAVVAIANFISRESMTEASIADITTMAVAS